MSRLCEVKERCESPASEVSMSSAMARMTASLVSSSPSAALHSENSTSPKDYIYGQIGLGKAPSIRDVVARNKAKQSQFIFSPMKPSKRKQMEEYEPVLKRVSVVNEFVSEPNENSCNSYVSDSTEFQVVEPAPTSLLLSISTPSMSPCASDLFSEICGPQLWPKYEFTGVDSNNYRPEDMPAFFLTWDTFLDSTSCFSDSVLTSMFEREKLYQPNPAYMEYQLISAETRAILFDWMMEVGQEFSLCRETIHLASNLIDRYLSVKPKFPRSSFQLAGVTALWMCSKVEELISPKASDFVLTTANAYSVEQMVEMENELLVSLNWLIQHVTPHAFVNIYIRRLTFHLTKLVEQQTITRAISALKISARDSIVSEVTNTEENFDVCINWSSDHLKLAIPSVVGASSENYPILSMDFHANITCESASITSEPVFKHFNLTHNLPPVLISLLSTSVFYRIMEILDVALLDISFVKFYPSALAASALCVVCPAVVDYLSLLCPYSFEQLQPCVAWLAEFMSLPHRGLLLPKRPFFDVKIPCEEYFTKQLHHPLALKHLHFK